MTLTIYTRKRAGGKNSKTDRPTTSNLSFGNAKTRQPGGGDLCAHHRGNSPSTPRRSIRKSSSDHVKKKQSLHQNNSENKSWDRKRKSSVFKETKTQTFPASVIKKQKFKLKPSSRSKKLYRFTRTFSEGFSESEHEDDWTISNKLNNKTANKNFKLSKQRISELANHLKSSKISEASIPKVVVEDFSKKLTPRFNKIKLKAFKAFLEGQSENKVVDISEVTKSDACKRKLSAVATLRSVSSKSDTGIDSNPSHFGDETPDEGNVSLTKTEKKINRSKLLAITSLTRLGKKEVDLIEIERDSDEEQESNKEQTFTENISTSTECEKNEDLRNDVSTLAISNETDVITLEEKTKPEVDSNHNQEATPKIKEEIVEKSLPEDASKELQNQISEINHEGPAWVEQHHDPQIEQSSTLRDLNPQEQFSQSEFDKSRNSKTAAMFQRHGKLLDDNIRAPDKNVKSKINKDKKSKKTNIFTCCLCCKKVM